MITQIGLRIGGTKERRAGFAPLVTVGVLAGNEGANMDRSSIIADNPSYLVKHGDGYILYMLLDIRVKSFDADAPGVLSIAVTIPSGQCLAEGKSPYTLLQDIYNLFVAEYMSPQTDGRHSFINKEIDDEPFRQIMAQYSLAPSASAYIPMNPQGLTGTLNVPAEKMADFMRDTQFPEFSSFKEIEVGAKCQSSIGLENLEIPRVHIYNIIVNGTPTGQTLRHPEDKYTTTLESTSMVEYTNVSFSLGGLLQASGMQMSFEGATIRLDPMTDTIHCTIPKRMVKYSVKVTLKRPGAKDVPAEDQNTGDYIFSVTSQPDKAKHAVSINISYRKETPAPAARPAKPKPTVPSDSVPSAGSLTPSGGAGDGLTEGYSRTALIISAVAGFAVGCLLVGCLWWFLGGEKEATTTTPNEEGVVYGDTLSTDSQDSLQNIVAEDNAVTSEGSASLEATPAVSEPSEAERAAEIEERKAQAEEAARKKLQEEAKKAEAAAKKAQDRAEIMALVNKGDITGCRSHSGWKTKSAVSKAEQLAIENILKKRDELKETKLNNDVIKKFKPFTWDNISAASKAITEWESKPENQ